MSQILEMGSSNEIQTEWTGLKTVEVVGWLDVVWDSR